MKTHSTNYKNTLIEAADDCKVFHAEIPAIKVGKTTIANLQFDLIYHNPYKFTSDELIFKVLAVRKKFVDGELDVDGEHFFSKGQPSLRTSPLTKKYGWGIHADENQKIALIEMESEAYKTMMGNDTIKKIKAMRSTRK